MSTKITIDRYNTIQSAINEILGTGATGYGQVLKSSQLSIPSGTSRLIYAQDVNNLVADLRRILQHQDGVDYSTNIPTVTAGTTKATNATYANLETYLAQATTNRWKMSSDASQSATVNGISSLRTTTWNSEIYHEAVANFGSDLNAKYFFNAGGELIISTSMSGQTGDKSNAWAQILNSSGTTVTMNYTTSKTDTSVSQIGFNDLTAAYQQIVFISCAAPFADNNYAISAKKDGQFVYFKITYTDAVTGTPDVLVNGTITSTVKYRGAVGASVVAPVPTVTSSHTLDSGGISQGYTVLLSPNSVAEGNNIQVTISSYPPVASVWYEITGDGPGVTEADFSDGLVKESKTLTTGGIQFNKAVAVDVLSDSTNVTMKLYDKDPAIPGAVLLKTSNTILINDGSLDLTLSLVSPPTPVLNETNNNIGNFAVVGTGLPATTTATWTATGTGAAHLTKTTDTFTISGGSGTFAVTVSPDHITTGDLPLHVKVSIGAVESNIIDLTINDTSKPIITYHSTKDPDFGLTAFTYDDALYYSITGGKPNGTFTFTRGTDAPVTRTLSNTGLFPHGSFDNVFTALTSPGTLHTKIVFDGESRDYTHDIVFTTDDQVLTLTTVPPDITSGKTLQLNFSLSKCYAPAVINWELVAPIPAGIYKSGGTLTSGTITTAGITGTGTGSLILEANAASVVKGTTFTVKFTLSTLTTINVTSPAIRIIDAFPYTTQLDEQIYLPTLASAVTIKARGGAGGGGGRDGGAGGAGGPAFAIVSKEPVLGTNHTVSTIIGKGGNAGGQFVSSLGGGLGGIGYKAGGNGGDVRNTGNSGGGGGGGGASAVLDGSTALVIAGGGSGGGGGSSGTANSGISGLGMFTTITNMVGVDGTAGAGGGSGDGGGGGGGGAFGGTGGTKGTDGSVRAAAGTPGNLAYYNNQPSITGTPNVLITNTGGLGGTSTITPTAGVNGEVTIYVQPMAPQYPVAQLQVSGTEYKIIADAPLKDGSSVVTGYTATSSVSPTNGISTATNPTVPVTFSGFTSGQRILFKLTADNVFGHGVEVVAPTQTAKFTTVFTGDNYGQSCAMSGDGNYLVVGIPYFNNGIGAVQVYHRTGNNWTSSGPMYGTDSDIGDRFGFAVDINDDGSRIIVGSPGRPDVVNGTTYPNTGAAHIFSRNPSSGIWSEEVFLESGNPDHNLSNPEYSADYFGSSVKISGDGTTVLIGAYGDDSGSTFSIGYIWHYYINSTTNSWAGVSGVTGSNYLPTGAAEAQAWHGYSLALSKNSLVCAEGAPGDNNKGWFNTAAADLGNAGTVCLFKRTSTSAKTWSALKTYIYSPTPAVDGKFGTSVALNAAGTVLVVGAPGENVLGITNAGSVHIFTGSGTSWSIQTMLVASDAYTGAAFGKSVSINDAGDTILVGANHATAGNRTGSGIVYKFVKTGTTWNQTMVITPYDKAANDSFGTSVSMNSAGDLAVIGAPNTDPTKAGAAYTFQI